jgi:hypothetical protein
VYFVGICILEYYYDAWTHEHSDQNNRDEIVGIFIQENVWLEDSLSQSEGEVTRRGRVRLEEQAMEDKTPKGRPVVVCILNVMAHAQKPDFVFR